MPPPSFELRPLALGDIIDHAVNHWRTRFFALFRLALGFQLGVYGISQAWVWLTGDFVHALPGRLEASRSNPADLWALFTQSGFFAASTGLWILTTLWLSFLSSVVGTRYVLGGTFGPHVSLFEALRESMGRVGKLSAAFAFSLLWGTALGLLAALPGVSLLVFAGRAGGTSGLVLWVLGMLVVGVAEVLAALWYFLVFVLLTPVVAVESLPTTRVIRRARELLAGRVEPGLLGSVKIRATLVLTVGWILHLVASLVGSLPALILGAMDSPRGSPMPTRDALMAAPAALRVSAELFQVALSATVAPLVMCLVSAVYLDIRVRREGLDLQRRLQAPDVPSAA